ncbi:MAG: hypothetical protein K9I69_00440 [Ignavibacteriales bacterium]|nr:hypothetical protein [Ignavibacteriales bacterium]MCF8305771.1 hypothetical protein [Ignavibacteriales bacterium]MCF8315493.1 hypothetical protein [Ignavibacteriales bacterium]MCF8436978.1 hypothetical protein [Ignavibacteriales bacterium]
MNPGLTFIFTKWKGSADLALRFWMLLLISFSSYYAQISAEDYFTPENRLRFADHLFADKDYLRAFYEYKEVISSGINDTAVFNAAYSLYKIGRYSEAIDYYTGLFINRELDYQAKIEFFRNLYLLNLPERFLYYSSQSLYSSGIEPYLLKRMIVYGDFIERPSSVDSTEFFQLFEPPLADSIRALYSESRSLTYKDPWRAAIYSAILPGAGKIYTGETGDGLTSLVVTGLLTYIAIDNLGAGHDFRGYLFGALAAYFYAGNIYGSFNSAMISNASVRINLKIKLGNFFRNNNFFLPLPEFPGYE